MAKETTRPAEPERVRNHKLTRYGMEQVIAGGGAVQYQGRTITKVIDLPSEAELAQGDKQAETAAHAELDRRQKLLDSERARLTGGRASAPAPATETASTAKDDKAAKDEKPAKRD